MSQAFGLCPKCLKMKPITRHHIYPCRHFRRSQAKLYICRTCHDELERQITLSERKGKMEKKHYLNVAINFMKGG